MEFLARRSRGIIAAILLAGFGAMLALNLPGQLSYDSIQQLHDGRYGYYHSWHPPVMAWLLGIGDAVLRGTAVFVVFNAALLFGALFLLLRLRPRPCLWGAPAALLCVALPQLLLYQGIIWKDVLFANAGVAGFACLAAAAADWSAGRKRLAWLGAAFLLLSLAAMTRQNGILILTCGAAGLVFVALRSSESPVRALAYGVAAFFLAGALAAAASFALAARGDHGAGARLEFKLLLAYDLAGALAHDPGLELGALHASDRPFELLLRGDGARFYTPTRNDPLEDNSPALWEALVAAPMGAVFEDWRVLVLRHPLLYLGVRAEIFRWVFLTPDISRCVPIFTGVDSQPADSLHELGMTARERPRDAMLRRYASAFLGTPVYSHAAFAAAALCLLLMLWRRHNIVDIALGFMLLGALGFTASFFFISIACDYRYLYFLDLSTLVAFFHLALGRRSPAGGANI